VALRIRRLGPPAIERDGVRASPPRGRKAWALLAIEHQVIHLSADGQLLKTVASRCTTAELPRPVQLGARPAGQPPTTTTPAGHHTSDAVEVDRLVNAAGLIGLGGHQLGVLIKTITSPVPASALHRLQGARAASSPLQAPQGRRWSSDGSPAKAASKVSSLNRTLLGRQHRPTTFATARTRAVRCGHLAGTQRLSADGTALITHPVFRVSAH
jgi:hypothetical protein